MKLIMLCTLVFHSCKDTFLRTFFFSQTSKYKMHKSSFHTNSPTYQNSLICVRVCFQITHTIKVRTLLSTHYKSLRAYPSCHRDCFLWALMPTRQWCKQTSPLTGVPVYISINVQHEPSTLPMQ